MLTRLRIEVEGKTTSNVSASLDAYETAVMKRALGANFEPDEKGIFKFEGTLMVQSNFMALAGERLGREVAEEVFEYKPHDTIDGGYVGRRVVRYRRLDTQDVLVVGDSGTAVGLTSRPLDDGFMTPNEVKASLGVPVIGDEYVDHDGDTWLYWKPGDEGKETWYLLDEMSANWDHPSQFDS